MFSIHLYERLAEGSGFEEDLTRYARYTWRRSIRRIGGYWTADFVISGASQLTLQRLYSTMIGKRIVEKSYGRTTWEGEVTGLALTLGGTTDEISMDAELWHNKVKCQYTYPSVQDDEQGVLAYVSPGGDPGFQDTLQDFGEWETLAGDSDYQIMITNNDGTTCSGYLGEATQTLNPDDSIWVFTDRGRGIAGFNGTTVAKVPVSYEVSDVDLAGTQVETAWSENVASSDIYGESQYVDVLAEECYAAAAEAERDRRLIDHAYPRSIPTGGLASDANGQDNQLAVTCSGYVFSINRRFYESNAKPGNLSDHLTTLIAATEYISDGGIIENTFQVMLTGANMKFRIWDEVEFLISLGASGPVRCVGGVYEGRAFRYDVAETEMLYEWRNNRLYYITGQPVPPTLIEPDIIVRKEAPLVVAPPGGSEWDNPTRNVITECEFIAPRSYRLIPADGDVLEGSW